MSGRPGACDISRRIALTEGWELGLAVDSMGKVPADILWSKAGVPGTVASSLRDSGQWRIDAAPRLFDAEEWWYRLRFTAEPAVPGERVILGFEGLATFAQVLLNGEILFESTNMFLEQRCDIGALLQAENELVIRFAPLDRFLNVRRARPRWRTPMVQQQQLRWVRTTLLGRTPGWSPSAPAVGPWRPIWLERRQWIEVSDQRLQATVLAGAGRLAMSCALSPAEGVAVTAARLIVGRGGREIDLALRHEGVLVRGEMTLPDVDLWWPHTHGEPALYTVTLILELCDSAGRQVRVESHLGRVGFRTLRLDREAGQFALYVNDRRIFCRGAAWMPLDCVSFQATPVQYRDAIELARTAGMNMLRVAGPCVYESDQFLDCCDAAGILLWQDFMFANMDYPADDAAFAASVKAEARQQLTRLHAHPALAVLCGNSEGAQQAAMSGAARECWAPPLFEAELAALSNELCPGVPYCPSSTHGGAFPFQPDNGPTSYYGVGAYFKPLSDARRSGLRFASECLGFANIPEDETLALLTPGQALRCHQPRWKERVPRDLGAGWDFDDVRDHYLQRLFRLDPTQLRYADHDRYLRLGRVASGEVMAAAFAEWRRGASSCSGALVWFMRDLWPGAGWGVIDSTGLPKAPYYYLKRVLQPVALLVSDEDCNGLVLHLVNETSAGIQVRLELRLYRLSTMVGSPVVKEMSLAPNSTTQIPATDLYDGFMDLSYSYRFGPPSYDVLHAALVSSDGRPAAAEAFYFPQGLPNAAGLDVGLTASAMRTDDAWCLTIRSKGFAQSVHIEAPGYTADDQYFHMIPNSTRTLQLQRRSTSAPNVPEGAVHALNALSPCHIAIAS